MSGEKIVEFEKHNYIAQLVVWRSLYQCACFFFRDQTNVVTNLFYCLWYDKKKNANLFKFF